MEKENLEMLVTVARLLSSKLDIKDLLTTIMRLAARVVNSERASLYLLDEKTNELYFDIALDLDEELKRMRFKVGEGIVGMCASTRTTIISNDVDKDPRHTKKVDDKSGYITKTLLTCPMIIKGKLIGVVQAINKIDGEFDDEDKNNFEAFASQAAIAIENSRLFNKVKDEKNKLENILKVINEAIVVTDCYGNIKSVNNSVLNFFGYNSSKHKTIFDLFEGFVLTEDISQLLKTSSTKRFLAETSKHKRLILECNLIVGSEIFNSEDEILWIFNDITKQILEERISREFLSLVSHKFKTPITSIVGYAQLLNDSKTLDKNLIEKATRTLISQSLKLNWLVDEMIDFSSIDNKTESDLNIADFFISDVVESVCSQINTKYNNVMIEKNIIDNFQIQADFNLFYKALHEVVLNGIKHNSKKEKKIIVNTKVINSRKIITVWDNGDGIPQNEIDKIFEKFYQIEPGFTGQTEGMGLGLPMVKKILELHKFSYRIKSEPQKFTLFTIIL